MAKTVRDEGINLTSALVLLIMLLVVIVSLLTYMLYEKDTVLKEHSTYCIPVSITPTP